MLGQYTLIKTSCSELDSCTAVPCGFGKLFLASCLGFSCKLKSKAAAACEFASALFTNTSHAGSFSASSAIMATVFCSAASNSPCSWAFPCQFQKIYLMKKQNASLTRIATQPSMFSSPQSSFPDALSFPLLSLPSLPFPALLPSPLTLRKRLWGRWTSWNWRNSFLDVLQRSIFCFLVSFT